MTDLSREDFEQRAGEVCGLYLDPPRDTIVVSLDEKTGIQAKCPTQPDRAPAPGTPAGREHEYTQTAPRTSSPA